MSKLNSMNIKIDISMENIDVMREKVSRLNLLLEEAQEIINSLQELESVVILKTNLQNKKLPTEVESRKEL